MLKMVKMSLRHALTCTMPRPSSAPPRPSSAPPPSICSSRSFSRGPSSSPGRYRAPQAGEKRRRAAELWSPDGREHTEPELRRQGRKEG
ncbi:hypothetical protein EYF80_056245 [Liparis tanakae]|uniref:Uncharacterized protein n=1 Tax=Liparis tanakae TaxID=230148 RepID=A0A4Z2EXN1_9TELE|nr:hypothetical protein EYF80_056245 [Liparis tanakae]